MYWFIHSFIHLLDGLFFSVFNLQLYISSAGTPLILTDMKLWLRWLANKSLSILIFMYWALQNLLPLPLGLFQSAAPWNRLTFLCIRQADLGMAAKQEGRFSVSDLAGHCELSLSPRFLQHCYDLAKTSFGSGMSSLSWCLPLLFQFPIPEEETTYACTFLPLPIVKKKHHIYKVLMTLACWEREAERVAMTDSLS